MRAGRSRSFFFSSRRRHTRWNCDWSSDVCSSDLTWLTTIAINEGRKRLRKAKGAAEQSMEEQEESHEGGFTPAPLTDWREIPLEALERKELREALRVAVAELPDIYRQVFTLRDLEELNVEETAQALGINPGAVKLDCKHVWEHIS